MCRRRCSQQSNWLCCRSCFTNVLFFSFLSNHRIGFPMVYNTTCLSSMVCHLDDPYSQNIENKSSPNDECHPFTTIYWLKCPSLVDCYKVESAQVSTNNGGVNNVGGSIILIVAANRQSSRLHSVGGVTGARVTTASWLWTLYEYRLSCQLYFVSFYNSNSNSEMDNNPKISHW